MTAACQPPAEQLCGCCTGLTQETPEVITNRPALSSIAYRAGRYATFNASMLAALSDPTFSALAPLRTRDTSDFSIALLDAWAVALDILTFYQERFANEAYLRSAVDQRSVIELAALVGYQPSPGVAASTVLAFTLSSAPGSPDIVLISAGTRVQSVPGPGQTSQVFETSADLTALTGWNALPAQTTNPWQLADTDTSTWISGTANNINPGDALLFVSTQNGQPAADFHYITAVNTDTTVGSPTSGSTQIWWNGTPSSSLFPSGVTATADVGLYVFRKKAALYGVQAPNPAALSGPNLETVPGYPLFPPSGLVVSADGSNGTFAAVTTYYWTVTAANSNGESPGSNEVSAQPAATTSSAFLRWNPVAGATAYNVYRGTSAGGENTLVATVATGQTTYTDTGSAGTPGSPPGVSAPHWQYLYQGGGQVNLDASYPGLQPPASSSDGPPQWAVLTDPNDTTVVFQIAAAAETSPNWYTLTAKTTQLTLQPYPPQTPNPIIPVQPPQPALATSPDPVEGFVADTPNVTAYVQSAPLTPADLPLTSPNLQGQYPLQPGMLAPVAGASVSVTGGQQIAVNQPIGISGRALRLQVSSGTFVPNGFSGGSQAAAGQVFLIDAFPPATDPQIPSNQLWAVTSVSGVSGALSVPADGITLLPAAASDPLIGEAATVQSVTVNGDVSTLTLSQALSRIYDAATVAVNANAVESTNGQTVQEILGSGDATNDALQFTLKQAPLTYLTAPTGGGAQSTLQVWVNNLKWHETPNLLTSEPADRVFVTSPNAAGNTVVQFGNGIQGARTPTGTSNIRATYRVGIGSPGMVSAGQLTQPLDRPQGLSSVTNPSAASGAADPATAAQARASAPLPTLTVGRVVSQEDYQNYALAFAGISKALATWTWFGNVRGVFLTVAGENGTTLSSDDPVVTSLIGAIKLCGDPHVPLLVASYVPLMFTFTAGVAVDQANYAPTQVLAQVWQNLAAAFAFDQRQLGQNVAASDIIEIIQQTPGVIAVQLQTLGRSGDAADGPVPPLLCASGPAPPQGAQMLLLDPATQGSIGLWS
jgi:hypothetical protein